MDRTKQLVDDLVAANTVKLVASWSTWVHRRVETLRFQSARLVQRTLEVEFSVPPDVQGAHLEQLHVPVAVVTKGEISAFRVSDEAGNRVPTLTSTESSERGAQLLAELALEICDTKVLPAEIEAELAEIARSAPEAAQAAVENFTGELSVGDDPNGDRVRPPDLEARRALAANPLFRSLATTLATNELLYVGLPNGDQARRLITLTYEQDLQSAGWGLRSIPEMLGWRTRVLWIDVGALGMARSTEFRLESPDGVEVSDAQLVAPPTGTRDELQHSLERTSSSVRVGISEAPVDARGFLVVRLLPEPAYPSVVLLAALFVAVLLTIGRFALDNLNDAEDGAAALLLAGPTLFSTAVAQPGRGTPGATLVVGARVMLVLAGLMTFLAAWVLVAVSEGSSQAVTWTVLMAIAWVLVVLLTPAVIRWRPSRDSGPRN